MNAPLKRILHALVGDYQYWHVYSIELPQPPVQLPVGVTIRQLQNGDHYGSEDQALLSRMDFGGDGVIGFGLFDGEQLVAVQTYWWGARYDKERMGRSWVLPSGAAKSTGLYTLPSFRGKGYAGILKRQSAHLMSQLGFTSLYSRIWHSHTSSIRVSVKAGWRLVGSYIEICPFGRRFQFRIPR